MADDESSDSKRDVWDILKIVSTVLAVTAIPVVIAVLGNALNQTLRQEESRIAMIELAVGVLEADPKSTDPSLREWAADIIGIESKNVMGVALTTKARSDMVLRPTPPSVVGLERAMRRGLRVPKP